MIVLPWRSSGCLSRKLRPRPRFVTTMKVALEDWMVGLLNIVEMHPSCPTTTGGAWVAGVIRDLGVVAVLVGGVGG